MLMVGPGLSCSACTQVAIQANADDISAFAALVVCCQAASWLRAALYKLFWITVSGVRLSVVLCSRMRT